MDCKGASSRIPLYMDGKLDAEELETFIKHINSCPDCAEELEIHYIMLEGVRRLEKGEHIGVDYQAELKNQLKRQLSHIHRQRYMRLQLLILGLVICIFGIFMGYFEQRDHQQKVMKQQILERGNCYFYHSTKEYLFDDTGYVPPSLKEIMRYGK